MLCAADVAVVLAALFKNSAPVTTPWPGEPDAGTVFPTYHRIDYVRVARAVTPASE